MKKLKVLIACCVCTLILVGCSKKQDESKLFKGTNEEIAMEISNDFKERNFDDLYVKYQYTSRLDELMSSGRGANIIEPQFNIAGEITSFENPYIESAAGEEYVNVPTHFENGDFNIVIKFDAEQKIGNIYFSPYSLTPPEKE